MISKSPIFCSAPWTSVNIDQTGRTRPCFSFCQEIANIRSNTIQEIIQGPFAEIKQHIARGEWHPGCHRCKTDEETTGASARTVRQIDPASLAAIDADINWFGLQHMIINWSNLCNLTCVYCNPDTSTAWQAALGQPIEFVRNKYEDILQLGREQGHNILGLSLGGGEPLLQKGLPEFLQYLNPQQVHVLVTTNLAVDLDRSAVYQVLKTWPRVTWQVSFDNVDPARFEYVRRGASWLEFENNIYNMLEDGQLVKAHPAYSIYNALDLVPYYQYCEQKKLPIFWCNLSHPLELDIRRQNPTLRRRACEEIDRVLAQWGTTDTQDNARGMDTIKLQGYKKQLEDVSYLFKSPERLDTIRWHRAQEERFSCLRTFEQLWPELAQEM